MTTSCSPSRVFAFSQLLPDLILANKEENLREQIEELANEFPVWVSDVNTLQQAHEMIAAIGELTGSDSQAHHLNETIRNGFENLVQTGSLLRTVYLIWKDPYMTVGSDTFIHDMLARNGFDNVFSHQKRYPVISIEDLRTIDCELLLLSSEPYPFQQKHIDELQHELPETTIMLVDGEMFSWYGSRLLQAPQYFGQVRQQIFQ